MHPDDELRSRLDRLVESPDGRTGWETHQERTRRAQRRRETLIASGAAATVAIVLATVAFIVGPPNGGTTRIESINRSSSSAAAGVSTTNPKTGPSSSAPSTTTRPSETSQPGRPGQPDTPGRPNSSTPPGADTRPQVPGTGSGSGTATPGGSTIPGSGATTVPGSGGTPTTVAPLAPIGEVRAGIEALAADHPGALRGLREATYEGQGPYVEVRLRADAIDLAKQIQATWPFRTLTYLGFFPLGPGLAPTSPCGTASLASSPPGLPLGVTGSLTLDPFPVPSGADFTGVLTLANSGKDPVRINFGNTNKVQLFPTDGGGPVGCYDKAVTPVLARDTIEPGAKTDIRLTGATASAVASLGNALPSGRYTGLVIITVGGAEVGYQFPVTVA